MADLREDRKKIGRHEYAHRRMPYGDFTDFFPRAMRVIGPAFAAALSELEAAPGAKVLTVDDLALPLKACALAVNELALRLDKAAMRDIVGRLSEYTIVHGPDAADQGSSLQNAQDADAWWTDHLEELLPFVIWAGKVQLAPFFAGAAGLGAGLGAAPSPSTSPKDSTG